MYVWDKHLPEDAGEACPFHWYPTSYLGAKPQLVKHDSGLSDKLNV